MGRESLQLAMQIIQSLGQCNEELYSKNCGIVVCVGRKWLGMNKPVMLSHCLGVASAGKLGWILRVLPWRLLANCTPRS